MAYESAQGLSFTFSGAPFTLTSLSFSKKVSEVDVSTLATKQGDYRTYRAAPLRDGDELQVEFYGMTLPQMTATGAISFTFDGSGTNGGLTTGIPTVALCTSSDLKAAAGELLKGSASFRLTQS